MFGGFPDPKDRRKGFSQAYKGLAYVIRSLSLLGNVPLPILNLGMGGIPSRHKTQNGVFWGCLDLQHPKISKHNFSKTRRDGHTSRIALYITFHALHNGVNVSKAFLVNHRGIRGIALFT